MSSSKPTSIDHEQERMVFLVARTVFAGGNAQIRQKKAIRSLIDRHGGAFRQITQNLGKDRVVGIIAKLLEAKTLESELKAKLAFPELYQVSAVRNLQHEASEQDAARSEEEALEELSQPGEGIKGDVDASSQTASPGNASPKEISHNPLPDLPSLFPLYLSYASQHLLLNTVQRLLEECCFEWVGKWIPKILEQKRWDCAEAVELSLWSGILPQRFEKLRLDATTFASRESFAEALKATHQLRHAAVHRRPTTCKGIERMLKDALSLIKSLHDVPRVFQIEELLRDYQARMKDMELNKNHLENELDNELREIQEQRAALDRREQEAKSNMLLQDRENTKNISLLFQKSIPNLIASGGTGPTDDVQTETNDINADYEEEGPAESDENEEKNRQIQIESVKEDVNGEKVYAPSEDSAESGPKSNKDGNDATNVPKVEESKPLEG